MTTLSKSQGVEREHEPFMQCLLVPNRQFLFGAEKERKRVTFPSGLF
jgi:hypothetical protein